MSSQLNLRRRAPLALAVAAAAAAIAGPATASAATLDVSADFEQVTYTAAPGENNSLLVREGDDDRGKTIIFKDSVPIEIVGLGRSTCFPVTGDPAFVTCYPIHGAFTRLTTSLGNGVNQLTSQSGSVPMFASGAGAISNTFDGGPGQDFLSGGSDEDQLQGGSGNDILDGQGGDDSLNAGSGTDELHGGADDDQLRGGLDADLLNGGTGVDHATYSERTTPLLVSLDGLANDGQLTPREGDNVLTNVEQVTGGSERDFLIGNDAPNRLVGGAGNDVITGGLGVDTMQGGIGNDTLRSKDGLQELVDCGADVDQVDADVIDLKPTCEGPAAPAVGIGPERVQLDARGRARLTLHCWATARKLCTGTLTLRHGTQPAGKKRFTIHSGHTTAVRVRLASTVQRKLDRKAVALDAMTKSRDGSGRKWTSRNTVTLVSR